MTPDDVTAAAQARLVALGADRIAHPGGTLLAHLGRVHELLRDWGARPPLRLAGLCHAFYGTDGFATALLPTDRRAELTALIGTEAEAIVYHYACCDRDASYAGLDHTPVVFRDRFTGATAVPSDARLRDFAELTAANEFDLVLVGAIPGQVVAPLLRRLRPWLSDPAVRALDHGLE
jgi:hypothetical protein